MRTLTMTILLFAFPLIAHSAVIEVPKDYLTIQEAIDAAVNGDTVLVAPGTYFENIDFKGKAITVTSSGGAAVTIIDGGNPSHPDNASVVYFKSGEGLGSVLEGFNITNGTGTKDPYNYIVGGGIYCYNSSPTITNNTIIGNRANDNGGGIFCHNASPNITNNTINDNVASEYGGGIYCYNSFPIIMNNTITWNCSMYGGGGLYCYDSSPIITNNRIYLNGTAQNGGGIHCWSGSSPKISNNTIINNKASTGGGIYCNYGSYPTVTNTIIWDNTAPSWPEIYGPLLIVNYCNIKGGYVGTGNINSDPLLVAGECAIAS